MGGIIGLTIRVSRELQYRGSCWTNLLPEGLFDTPFYIDLDTSKAHTWGWLQNIIEHRRGDPQLEKLWGGHNMLAPIEYGIVVVDYVTSTIVSAQGYSSPHWMTTFADTDDAQRLRKWDALDAAGLLGEHMPWSRGKYPSRRIKMPFEHVRWR